MREFLDALEQWKSFLDSSLEVGAFEAAAAGLQQDADSGAPSNSDVQPKLSPADALLQQALQLGVGGNAAAGSAGLPPSVLAGATSQAAPDSLAVNAAMAQVTQAQYLQQLQFYQQMQVQDASVFAQPDGTRRFKEGFRPMRMCKHFVQTGSCWQGSQCTFGHHRDELHHSSVDVTKAADKLSHALAQQQAIGLKMPQAEVAPPLMKRSRIGERDDHLQSSAGRLA